MMNNNKILTVSYGTFSCTLEGFDDSFGTMKAIAEYFRDLAADDRYFGAEPPQPDAEMLARIAQKEISRRVEAREHEGKIVLSAMDDDAAALASPAAAAAATALAADDAGTPQEAPAQVETSEDTAEALVDDDVAEEESPQDLAEVETAPESIADEPVVDEEPAEEEAAEQTVAEADVPDIVPGQPDAEVEAFFDSAEHDNADTGFEDEIPDSAEMDAPVADPVPDSTSNSIAAKLERIRAVVSQHDHDDEDEIEDSIEDSAVEPADIRAAIADAPSEADAGDVVAEARRDIEDALGADDAEDVAATAQAETAADPAQDDDDISDILNRLDAADEEMERADTSRAATLMADVAADDEDDEAALENLFEDTVDAADMSFEDETEEVAEVDTTADAPAAEEAAPAAPRARVIKVKRADLEAAIERGELEEYDDTEADEPQMERAAPTLDDLAPARTSTSSLSPEEEDDLARELAALEAEMAQENAGEDAARIDEDDSAAHEFEETMEEVSEAQDAVAEVEDEVSDEAETRADDVDEHVEAEVETAETDDDDAPETQPGRDKLASLDAPRDENVNRLMAEADNQMDEPESATRRDAFAHLRAAVAAKKADQALGSDEDTVRGDQAYRSDLADVVRPRRPVSGNAKTPRPGAGRPAPLKLVAEQRIDTDRPVPAGPVRPRRVATVDEPQEAPEGESFADFAAEMGATNLPDMLEAAAAYMSFVEGREQFSRPQLMSKVRQAEPEGFSREDALRSFGTLLRNGKISKIKGGRFAATEDIGFRPDARAAG